MKASHIVIILLTIWFLMVSAAAWAAYAVFVRPGMIEVNVSERRHLAGGAQAPSLRALPSSQRDWDVKRGFTLYLPAGVANGAIRMTGLLDNVWRLRALADEGPFEVYRRGDRELAELFEVLAEELETEMELRILEVRDGDEGVMIDVTEGTLRIEVESWDESVRITIPPSTLRATLDVARDLAY